MGEEDEAVVKEIVFSFHFFPSLHKDIKWVRLAGKHQSSSASVFLHQQTLVQAQLSGPEDDVALCVREHMSDWFIHSFHRGHSLSAISLMALAAGGEERLKI